jgi:hypothetical protein
MSRKNIKQVKVKTKAKVEVKQTEDLLEIVLLAFTVSFPP